MGYPTEAFFRRSGSGASSRAQDPRTQFARDRDRLLYSSAFRRLAGKSQVVASTEIGPFHTRLTHSLKVAQLGRRLAEHLRVQPVQDRKGVRAPDPDLVEFACLAHDIGHPPFGHTGESALHEVVDRLVGEAVENSLKASGKDTSAGDVSEAQRYVGGFEGNPQTFRIVTRLSHKAFPSDAPDTQDEQYLGLDLTAAAIDAVSKYPWGRQAHGIQKWGAYGAKDDCGSDYHTLDVIRTALGWGRHATGLGAKKSFECQLMEWCDDVTYAVHDVEDFYMVGMIPLERIFKHEKIFVAHLGGRSKDRATRDKDDKDSEGTTSGNDASNHEIAAGSGRIRKEIPETDEWCDFRAHLQRKWAAEKDHLGEPRQIDDAYLNSLRDDLIGVAYESTGWDASPGSIRARRLSHRRASDLIQHFASKNIGYNGDPLLSKGDLNIVGGDDDEQADREKRLRYQCDMLKELIWRYVIDMPNLKTQQAGQRRIVGDLVKIYADARELMPPHFVELAASGAGYRHFANIELSKECFKRLSNIRASADYVSSLTEPQALALHKRLTGVELGGFRDFV